MTTSISATALPNRIQQLLEQRQQHIHRIGLIDQTLAGVSAALGGTASGAAVARPVAAPAAKASASKGKRRRSRFGASASALVLAFVKAKKNPTTNEIMRHLASEGRTAGSCSNALSVLAKAGELKRTPLGKGILGSRYSLA